MILRLVAMLFSRGLLSTARFCLRSLVGSSMQLVVVYVLYSTAVIASTSMFRRDRFDEAIAFFGSSLLYSRESGATCFDVGLL